MTIRNARALAAATSGASLGPAELIRRLGAEGLEERVRENLRLAADLLAAGAAERARPFLVRAFQLSGGAREVLPLFERVHVALGDFAAVRAARKRVGLAAAAALDPRAVSDLNAWQNTDSELRGRDTYEIDEEVLAALRRLASPHRLPPRLAAPPQGRRLRVAHLLFGMTHQNSVIVRISRLFARFHDRSRFEPAFFAPESAAELKGSPQGEGHVSWLREQGCTVHLAPAQGTAVERMAAVARQIHESGADLLLTSAALADLHHYLVVAMAPAPVAVGLVSGPPAQFAPPDLDHGISWTWHTQMESPIPCSRVPLETDLPDPARLALRPRASLGVPGDAVLVATAGRPPKLRSPALWQLALQLLDRFPAAHFLCVGATAPQLPEIAPLLERFRGRVHFAPWMDAYLEVLGQADVVLDTFPSGGSVALTDAMALAKPVVAFHNDYGRIFDQADWSPAHEYMPECELVVPRGDQGRFLEVAGRLVADPAYRRSMGLRCQADVRAQRGDPERMVRRCEAVLERVFAGKARGGAA